MNLNPALVSFLKQKASLINYQTVRWRRVRKPFWVGIAKSKMFKVLQPFKKYTPLEYSEYLRLRRDYYTHHRSLMKFIKYEDPRMASIITSDEKVLADLETQMEESLKKNDLWNAECAKVREEILKENTEGIIKKVLEEVEFKQKEESELLKELEEIVKIEKALSKTYITPENLDEAIDKCLENVAQYDFAIDSTGNKYYGRETMDKRATQKAEIESSVTG